MKKKAFQCAIYIIAVLTFSLDACGETITYPFIHCGDWGYSAWDTNEDCNVNMDDFVEIAQLWMACTDPSHLGCTDQWRDPHPPFPDAPIANAPVQGLDWTKDAIIVQPWGKSEWDIVAEENIGNIPQELADTYGLNAIILNPPCHDSPTWEFAVTEEEFQAALTAYRAAGFKIILYSAIVGSADCQGGFLGTYMNDWLQIDPQGQDGSFLCPNTKAFENSLGYTKWLISQYHPDAIMLDNNQFLWSSDGGETCYCSGCQAKFREYVVERFGGYCEELFGVTGANISIPTNSGDLLYRVWIHWRNRTWAEANEKYRAAISPVLLFANTQYQYGSWILASDLQIQHEDMCLSETGGPSPGVSEKMILGHAFATGRPLWTFMGTYQDYPNLDLLRSPSEVSHLIAAVLGQLSNPWLVYFGFDNDGGDNVASRAVIGEMFRFRRDNNIALYHDAEPWGHVATILGTRARNYDNVSILHPNVQALQRAGIAVQEVLDLILTELDISKYEVIVAEKSSNLSDAEADKLVAWMEAGGTLVAMADLGSKDDIGRVRGQNAIAERIGRSLSTGAVGAGQLVIAADTNSIVSAVQSTISEAFVASGSAVNNHYIEVRPYMMPNGTRVLHVINHDATIVGSWQLQIPQAVLGTYNRARLFRPDIPGLSLIVPMSPGPPLVLQMPAMDTYGVVMLDNNGG